MFGLFKENVRIAFDSIKSQLLRTILTVMIIAIGITALVGILSAVSALENTISGDFSAMGANTFNIRQYEFNIQMGGRPGERQKVNPILSYNEVKEFKEKFEYPFSQTSISFTGTASAEVRFETEKTDPEVRVLGVNEYFLDNSGLKLEKGRNFTVFDIENNNNVCILGADFYEVLFKDINPIDKTISIRGVKFKVIGILEEKGSTFGNNQDLRVLIPIQNARSIFTAPNINYEMSVKIDNKEMMEGAQDEATITFRNIRGLSPVQDNNFGIERSDSLLNQIFAITGYLDIAAWIISIITIFGSSIALMNIMLVSVTERTHEIGLRKALGATRREIMLQFLVEAAVLTCLGGIIGIIGGLGLAYAITQLGDLPFSLPIFWVLAAVVVSVGIGIVFGLYPANRAASLDPVEALRFEV